MTVCRRLLAVVLVAGTFAPALAATRVAFDQLYQVGTGVTEAAQQLAGSEVELHGFMAPPLKADAGFFVLTRTPMAFCPFCDSEAEWPEDLVVVTTDQPIRDAGYSTVLRVRGRLETGVEVDPETGFVSLVRIEDAEYEPM